MAHEKVSLFEANTVSRISPHSQNKTGFSVLAPSDSQLCVVIGDLVQVVVFLNYSEPTLFKLECPVDCVGWSEDDTLLVLGDRRGSLHFVSPALRRVLFSQEVGIAVGSVTCNPVFTSIGFFSSKDVEVSTLYVLCSVGLLLVFRNLTLNKLRQALDGNDTQLMKQFKDGITMTKLDISSEHDIYSSFLLPLASPISFNTANFITTGRGRSGLCVWGENGAQELEVVDSVSYLLRDVCVSRCAVTEDGKYLITLSDTGSLAVWNLCSLVMINMWMTGVVKDFSLCQVSLSMAPPVPREGACSDRVCLLNQDSAGKRTLTLASLPDLCTLYTLEVQSEAGLVHGRGAEDSLYFTEIENNVLLVKHLTEALPEQRLATLLALEKFDEAEELARKFDLDAEVVHQTKTRVLNNMWISKTLAGEETADVYTNLLECVEYVQDAVFVGELVLSSHYPTLDMTLNTLRMAKNKLKHGAGKGSQVKATQLKVLSALNKLVTFQMLRTEDRFSSEAWVGFVAESLLDHLKVFFLSGSLNKITILWNRHIGELVSSLSGSDLLGLLSSLPEVVASSELGIWLSHTGLPFILQHTPHSLAGFLKWVQMRVRLLELSEKEQWPRNGLHLCDAVLGTLSSFKNPTLKLALQASSLALQDLVSDSHSALSGLKSLQQSLQDICYLQTSLECSVTLFEHEKESREVVVYRLLDQAKAAELVSATIQRKVIPYVERCSLNLDKVLLDYVKLFLSQSPRFSASLSDSPYEAKAIALVGALKDKELYVSGCIEVLRYVHTPWSEGVEELVQGCLKVDHPHVATLEKQYQLLQLKKLLHGYGIKNVNFSDTTSSYRWLYIHRILSSERATMLEDALKVADMYHLSPTEVYKIHVMNLGLKNKIIAAGDLLRTLPSHEQIATAQCVFELASSKLKLPFNPAMDDPEEYAMTTRVALLCLSVLRDSVDHQDDSGLCTLYEDWVNIDRMISLYERLLSLQVEFAIILSPGVLVDRDACHQLFQEKVAEFSCGLSGAKQESSVKSVHRSSRFVFLLGYTERKFFEAVAIHCAKAKNLEAAKAYCWELLGVASDDCSAPLLLYIVQQWWASIKSDPGSVSGREIKELQDLASQAVALANKSLLLSATIVYSACALLGALHSHCEGLDTDIEDEQSLEGLKPGLPVYFREDGLMLDQQGVLSAAVQCAEASTLSLCIDHAQCIRYQPPQSSGDALALRTMMEQLSVLSQTLQDNGHFQLATLCTAQSFSLYCQHAGLLKLEPQTALEEGHRVLHGLLLGLTGKVLSARKLDHDYALSLLLMLPPTVAAQKLQSIKMKSISSYSRVISLCNLAENYSHISGQPQLSERAVSIRSSAEWGKRLSKVKISFTEAFRGGQEEKKQVAEYLFRSKLVDIDIILQYCSEVLGNKQQSVLLAYLRVVLTEWEEPCESLERAAVILKLIHNKQQAQELLAGLLGNKISPYDYERVSFILSHLVNGEQALTFKAEQGLLLLDCLKCYTRESSPSEFEKNWYSTNRLQLVNSSVIEPSLTEVELPVHSSERLPFHYLLYDKSMEIIGQELSCSTVNKLVPIAKILKLDGDDFYSVAIKNIVPSLCDSNAKSWFGNVLDLLGRIKNLKLALSITKWLAKQLSTDEERVEALSTAVSIAHRWKEQAHSEDLSLAKEKLQMFTTLLRITQTDKLLRQHKLEDFFELSAKGATLVMKMYTDIPVTKPQPGQTEVDVHSLVREIARIHNLNMDKIKSKLTEMWLTSTKAESKDMDVTQMSMMEDPTEGGEEEESEDELNLKRLKYLLNVPAKIESNVAMLLRWAKHTSSTASSIGNVSRVKALQVLFAIAPDQLIESVSGTSVSGLREYMQSAVFVSELERLHMTTSVSAFQACNKEGLVKSLWRNHFQEPRALRLIGELCLYYLIRDSGLWSKLLQALLSLGMLPYLRHVLRALSSHPDQLVEIQILPSIWQNVLLFPFQDASPPLSPFQQEECTQSLHLLMGCPFLMELDISQITGALSGVGLLGHALAATLVMPTERDKQVAVEAMLNKLNDKSLVKLIDELSSCCELAGYTSEIEELVYLYVNSSGRHQGLLGSQHFTTYVHFLVARKMIDGLVTETLKANKVPEAVQLVELYNQHHSLSNLSGLELLKDYVEARELLELKNIMALNS